MASPFVEIEVGPRTVKVTNPDKLTFPAAGISKMEVVDYYLAVGDGILRALHERPVTLERWSTGVHEGVKVATRADGRGADAFYQKRISKGAPPWVETAHITFPSGRTANEVCPTELATVAWCAQQNTITFHPWPVRRVDVDHPDELRIDLDPQPGTDFHDVVEVAAVAREVLAELGWRGFPKTSGNRGLHVYAPIKPTHEFLDVQRIAAFFQSAGGDGDTLDQFLAGGRDRCCHDGGLLVSRVWK